MDSFFLIVNLLLFSFIFIYYNLALIFLFSVVKKSIKKENKKRKNGFSFQKGKRRKRFFSPPSSGSATLPIPFRFDTCQRSSSNRGQSWVFQARKTQLCLLINFFFLFLLFILVQWIFSCSPNWKKISTCCGIISESCSHRLVPRGVSCEEPRG